MDVWTVSIIILIVSLVFCRSIIGWKTIIKSLFPTTFANNWYLTCYILFYSFYPFLNVLINKLSQNSLFLLSAVMIILYTGINFVKDSFFSNEIIIWIAVYFAIAYIKKYLPKLSNNIKLSVIFFCLALFCHVVLIISTNYLGLQISFLADKMNHWVRQSNPLIIIMVVSLFNIVRNLYFSNSILNYISSLSLLIYIIHENVIIRTYFRTFIWHYIFNQYGYSHLLIWIIIFAAVVFVISIILSSIYKHTIEKLVVKISNKLTLFISDIYHKIEPIILEIR